jgi:hypothetical protein
MKKIMIVLATAVFTACGGNSSTEQTTTDSLVVSDSASVVDSAIAATDSTTSQIPVGGETPNRPVPVK